MQVGRHINKQTEKYTKRKIKGQKKNQTDRMLDELLDKAPDRVRKQVSEKSYINKQRPIETKNQQRQTQIGRQVDRKTEFLLIDLIVH